MKPNTCSAKFNKNLFQMLITNIPMIYFVIDKDWKILVVDDDIGIHEVTEMAHSRLKF